MRKLSPLFLFGVIFCPAARAAAPIKDDQILVYEMKEDPTVGPFISNNSVKGFYALEIDELNGIGAILYKVDDRVYRAEADLRVSGSQLTLKIKKQKKVYVRENTPDSGQPDMVYPVECPPSRGGWRHGPSFGRHVVKRTDDVGRRIVVVSAAEEFELARERCADPSGDCGDPGCKEWEIKTSTSAKSAAVAASSSPVAVPLSKTLAEGKKTGPEILTAYASDIDTLLPPVLNDLQVTATGYRSTPMPYPGVTDPIVLQRNLSIGVIYKNYMLPDRTTLTVEIEPLLSEFRDGSFKCGNWDSGPDRTRLDVRGRPALFTQAVGGGSALYVCGQTVSIAVQSTVARSQGDLLNFFNYLPIDQIESVAGPK